MADAEVGDDAGEPVGVGPRQPVPIGHHPDCLAEGNGDRGVDISPAGYHVHRVVGQDKGLGPVMGEAINAKADPSGDLDAGAAQLAVA